MGDVKHIILTGATGFLGSHLLHHLIKENYNVVVLKREKSNTARINTIVDRVITYDIESEDLTTILSRHSIDTIIHVANERSSSYYNVLKTNVLFPMDLIEKTIKAGCVKHFINTDTFFTKAIYGLAYSEPYSSSKRILLSILKQFSELLKIVNIRLEHIFGEKDSNEKFVTKVINSLFVDSKIDLTSGIQKGDFIYVDDVCKAFSIVLSNIHTCSNFSEYEVRYRTSISVKDFITKLQLYSNSKTQLNFGAIPLKEGKIMDSFANIAPLKALGWAPSIGLESGIKNVLSYHKQHH